MPYGSVRDAWDCAACEDEGNVLADCVVCDGSGDIIISADGDLGVCGECGGTGTVAIPCPKCQSRAAAFDAELPALNKNKES